MKQKLKFILPAILLGLVFAGAAHAQISTPNYWKKIGNNVYPLTPSSTTIGTSTAKGQFGTLTDGAGNKYSTSTGSSNVSTSSANTWGGAQTFSSSTAFNADISVGSSSVVYASPLGYTLTSTFQVYVSGLCAQGLVNASATQVNFPGQLVPSGSFTDSISLTGINARCHLHGIGGGGTKWNYGGTNPMIVLDNSKVNNHVEGVAVEGIHFVNTGSASTSTGPIGIMCGGSNGCAHQVIQYNTFQNFGKCIVYASNTYDSYLEHNTFSGCGMTIQIQTANNSTEGLRISNNEISDPGGNNPNDCIVLETSCGDAVFLTNNIINRCQIHQKNGTVLYIVNNKTEPASTNYPSFVPFLQDSSGFSVMNITNEKLVYAATPSTTLDALFDLNSYAYITGVSIDPGTGTSTMPVLLKDSAASSNENVTICGVAVNTFGGRIPYTAFATKALNIPSSSFNGCVSQVGDSTTTLAGSQSDGSYAFQTTLLKVSGDENVTGTISQAGIPLRGLFSGTSFVNINNSSSSTTLIGTVNGTTTIAANTLKAGSTLRFTAGGLWTTNASGTNASYFIFLGASSTQSNVVNQTGVGAGRAWSLNCTISIWSAGASGVWDPNCFFFGGVSAGGVQVIYIEGTTSTIDTTVANVFDFKWLYATASSTNAVTSTAMMLSVNP